MMKKLALLLFFTLLLGLRDTEAWCGPGSALTTVTGTFLRVQNNLLSLQSSPAIHYTLPLSPQVKVVSPAGPFSFSWLLPGDGVRLFLDNQGAVNRIEAFVAWSYGTVAFTSHDRLTLLEGPQFFTNGASIFLNGRSINDLALLKPPNEVLIRFDTLQRRTVGIWAFDPSGEFKENSGFFRNHSWVSVKIEKTKLKLSVRSIPSGKLSTQLLGDTRALRLTERARGHYEATLFIPPGVAIPRNYIEFRWQGFLHGDRVDASWIHAKPVLFYAQKPEVEELAPPNGSTVPVNPPFIFASFDPEKAPLDSNSVRFLVDRKNVAADCYIDSHLVFYSPGLLAKGRHECALSARTLGGGEGMRVKWNFYVH